MILATHGIIGSSIGGFDADYQAILDYATTQSYTLPSAGQQILQNQLVLDLKAGGIWSLMDIIYVYASDGDSNYATLNWKNPSFFQCTQINSPTFTANEGFTGNGTSSYLNTNWSALNNGVNFQLNDASIVCYVFSNSGTGPFTGIANNNSQGALNINSTAQRINTTASLNSSAAMSGNGYTAMNKTSSLNVTMTKGTNQQNRTITTETNFSENNFILRRGVTYGLHTIAYASYGANMEPYDSIYNTILTNYINSL
jgi:hypothetical protein